jgi:DNA-binding SARP family transcriptional activator
MEFCVLGPFEVRLDGRTIDIRGSKRRAVLALLVLHANEVVRAERLIDQIWGDARPANASAALQNHISRLRKDLGADVVVTKPWGYVLRTESEAIDLCRFERLVTEAKPLPAKKRRELLGQALALWRGPALADLALESALAVECARLDDLRLAAIEERVDAELELGANDGLIAELEELVAAHPLRESLRGQLILALYRSGRQADALETYRETRRVLVEELGIEPSLALRELEQAILRQDPSLASAPPPRERTEVAATRTGWRWPRSPLTIAAALLILAGAGTAVALVPAPGEGHPPVAKASPAPAAPPVSPGAPPNSSNARSAETTANRPKVATTPAKRPRSRVTRHHVSRQRPVTHPPRASRPVGAVKTGAPHRSTPRRSGQKPTAAPPARRPPNPATEKPPWVTISDDFSDGFVDRTIWHVVTTGTEVDVTQQGGRLEVSIGGGAVAGGTYNQIDGHYGTMCMFPSDFDAQVDFTLLDWPESSGVFAGLNAFFADTAVGRQSSIRWGEQYASWSIPINGNIPDATDATGSVRIARTEGLMSTYVMHKGRWVRLTRWRKVGTAVLGLQAMSSDDDFGHKAVRVAFDNFRVKAKNPTCPYR